MTPSPFLVKVDKSKVVEIGNRAEAIKHAAQIATTDDTIAILGKGHETTQEIAGQVFDFDDAKHLEDALKQRFGKL